MKLRPLLLGIMGATGSKLTSEEDVGNFHGS